MHEYLPLLGAVVAGLFSAPLLAVARSWLASKDKRGLAREKARAAGEQADRDAGTDEVRYLRKRVEDLEQDMRGLQREFSDIGVKLGAAEAHARIAELERKQTADLYTALLQSHERQVQTCQEHSSQLLAFRDQVQRVTAENNELRRQLALPPPTPEGATT